MKLQKSFLISFIFLLCAGLMSACGEGSEATPPPRPTVIQAPTSEPCPEDISGYIPFFNSWKNSGHADTDSQAFRLWDDASPAVVPTQCASCHSSTGFLDFIGADGSSVGTVETAAPINTVISCATCHNKTTGEYSSVTFPSGMVIPNLERDAVCITCHLGRAYKIQVDTALQEAGGQENVDQILTNLNLFSIHYATAAVSRFGGQVVGGYQYSGKSYDIEYEHVAGMQACQDCHNPHSLQIEVDKCAACHRKVTGIETIRDIRMMSSTVDYDGDGDVKEGIYYEVQGLREKLILGIQAYTQEILGRPLAYSKTVYPYFFFDVDENGVVNDGDIEYDAWTARLVKAVHNLQAVDNDPGGYAHGGKYLLELMYDSIEDLNLTLTSPIDLSASFRQDVGHFDGSSQAFRHWDEEGLIKSNCAKCHTAGGLPQFLAEGVIISQIPSNGFRCSTCHDSLTSYTIYSTSTVAFPSGAELSFSEESPSNLCLNCHQGTESTTAINRVIEGVPDDAVLEDTAIRLMHGYVAGATLFGTNAKGMFEYPEREYMGQFLHTEGFGECASCHDKHALEINKTTCSGCHQVDDPSLIRFDEAIDYDGDGDITEGIKGEIETLHSALYAAIQSYALGTIGIPIVNNPDFPPYFFSDENNNGQFDFEEPAYTGTWTPRLIKAAYNYQYVLKDPGIYAHNAKYAAQVLIDSIEDIGGDVSAYLRP